MLNQKTCLIFYAFKNVKNNKRKVDAGSKHLIIIDFKCDRSNNVNVKKDPQEMPQTA